MSLGEARDWVHDWPDLVLSVVDEPSDAVATSDVAQVVVCFRDVVTGDDLFTPAHARRLLEAAALISQGDHVLVHCRGGIGRSPAVAVGILAALGYSPEEAVRAVFEVREQADPNPRVLAVFDEILALDGALGREARKLFGPWRKPPTTKRRKGR
jgi:predicted protein tyrosine phosphatase